MKRKDSRYYLGDFSKGCRKCAKGAKMVLLVTGLCPRSCYYCPLSEQKYKKDVVYANEAKVQTDEEIVQEAKAMRALGTGITGGEPMMVPDRTIRLIKLLKKNFGKNHHIHLYTTGEFDKKLVGKFSKAGLDEIRFHPPVDDWARDEPAFLPVFKAALRTKMDVGIEIPAIPQMERAITDLAHRYFGMGMHFLNLNELEASETNWEDMRDRGFELMGDSYAIKGSKTTALKVLRGLQRKGYNVNFCTSGYKDAVQLRRRLLRRARTIGRPYQLITDDATFYYGIVEPEKRDQNEFQAIMKQIIKEYGVPRSLYRFQDQRLDVASWVLEELYREIPFKCYLIETYPSVDGLEVERMPLN
jgi:pyruvate formate-lyase activating enzyme-like uncharacterized protein